MNLTFDSGELEGSKYLGAGTHECRITKIERKGNKKGTGELVEIEFTAASGRSTRDWFPITGNKFKLGGLAIACGFSKELLLGGKFDTAQLANRFVKVVREVTGEEAYTDKDGKAQTRKNFESHYLPSAQGAPSQTEDTIPF